ncbi:MAG TPA: hypothetical protein PKC21_08595 [Oligoflexia bacterium]|nr:hypothetical protein [Oligoflexia bacterium]
MSAVLLACCMLSYCASKPKVPGERNTKKKTNNNQVTEKPDTTSNQKTIALEKTETSNNDHVEVVFSLKNTDTLESYTIFSKWNKEALLEADADIASLDWEDAAQGKSGMKLKLPRDSEETYKAYVYVKVQNKSNAIVIKESFIIDVPALEEETDDQEENTANALAVLEGDKILCAAQQGNKAVVISYDTAKDATLVNESKDNLKTWTVLSTMNDLSLEDAQNCHVGIYEDYVFIISDALLTTDSEYSNAYFFVGPDHRHKSAGFLTLDDFSLLANQFNIKDLVVTGDRAYMVLSNEEQNKIISLHIDPTGMAVFDRGKTTTATLSGIPPLQTILPEQEDIASFYDFTFLTQDKRSYFGNKESKIDWDLADNDLFCLMNSGDGEYYIQYQQANKKIMYHETVITFNPETYEENYSWIPYQGELTVPLAAQTIQGGAENQLILHNESQVFFLHIDQDKKETGKLFGFKQPQNS